MDEMHFRALSHGQLLRVLRELPAKEREDMGEVVVFREIMRRCLRSAPCPLCPETRRQLAGAVLLERLPARVLLREAEPAGVFDRAALARAAARQEASSCAGREQQRKRKRADPGPRRTDTPFTGVSWNPALQQWEVCVPAAGSPQRVALFQDEVEAAKAYNREMTRRFGHMAVLNALGAFAHAGFLMRM